MGQVAKYNNTFNMTAIERYTHEALDGIIKEDWDMCVKHAENIRKLDNQKKILRQVFLEPIIMIILSDDGNWNDNEQSDIEQLELILILIIFYFVYFNTYFDFTSIYFS